MCRKKGRVILVGVSGMNIKRSDIYKNEIDLKISASYGPGRYDDLYELEGQDYPYAYVRWTENRNISEYLRLVNKKIIDLDNLNPKIYPIEDVESAYEDLKKNPSENILTILNYDEISTNTKPTNKIIINKNLKDNKKINVGIIGAGNFAKTTLIPILDSLSEKFKIKTIVNRNGHKAMKLAQEFKADVASTSTDDILNDDDINLVVITTRHDSHTEYVLKCLKKNKHVFVEKPLATNMKELDSIRDFYIKNKNKSVPITMVGFNRRFSPISVNIKKAVSERSNPLFIHYRMNAGYIPVDSWIHKHGGRIVGEGCHIIDLFKYITGSSIEEVSINNLKFGSSKFIPSDNKSITFKFKDGSVLPKEHMEIHFDNKSLIMDDYKTLEGFGVNIKKESYVSSRKGHYEEWQHVYESLKRGLGKFLLMIFMKPLEFLYWQVGYNNSYIKKIKFYEYFTIL